ncbi:MAG: helix-turn-helix transcriptional regulator [Bdellovibrionales bacterium]|nr:helix-turn-helix transcriptional regulator [Bdellovibrionales bacterium]
MEIKRVLKELLKERDLSVAQLARVTGVPRQTIDNWMAGQEPRSLKQVKKIADYFAVPLDFLCFGESARDQSIQDFEDEINAGVFEVVLRRVKRRKS